MDIYFSTNGSLLNEKMSISLIKSGLDRLQVSLDAFTEETYRSLRPGGNFQKVVENVKNFLRIRNERNMELPTLRVNFVKQKENIDELQDFCNYWMEQGADSIGIQDFSEWMVEKDDSEYQDTVFHCNMPFNRLVIRYNGDVLPCCLFMSTELVLGNIHKNSIEEMWNSSFIKKLRELHSADMGWKENPTCRKCVKSLI